MTTSKFTVGADPEIFVQRNGKFVNGYGLVPGTKDEPHFVNGGAVQVDGMALEFNIMPVSSEEDFLKNLAEVQAQLGSMIGDLEFMSECSVEFDDNFVSNAPEESLIMGCDPDYDAYTLSANRRPSQRALMRTAGGHVHVGGVSLSDPLGEPQMGFAAKMAKALDQTLGIYSLFWDENDSRRSMYGQAGAFRPKTYGMEYRTLSNAWLFKPELKRLVYRGVEQAWQLCHDPFFEGSDTVREIINTSNRSHPMFNGDSKVAEIREIMVA